jgi:hypothetical protein
VKGEPWSAIRSFDLGEKIKIILYEDKNILPPIHKSVRLVAQIYTTLLVKS